MFILYALLITITSWFLTKIFLSHAKRNHLIDMPNQRSSHTTPTPRGAGIVFAGIFICTLLLSLIWHDVEPGILYGLIGAGLAIAIIGYLDDAYNLSVTVRLLIHLLAISWVLYSYNLQHLFDSYGLAGPLRWAGYILLLLYLVWLLNLYNFMDGINGIAAIEAITVCVGGAFLLYLAEPLKDYWLLPACLAAAVTGFIYWNFPIAKIFMGDVGSGFLGVVLGAFSVLSASISPELFWSWFILLAVFITDATVTLIRRALRREKIHQAHCSHAYQWAARKWGHTKVTLGVFTINILWLYPMAFSIYQWPDLKTTILVLTFVPLIYTAIILGAGRKESEI